MEKSLLPNNNGKTFEENYELICSIVDKNRHRWRLKAVLYMDWDDVRQLVIIHIFQKFHLYNVEKDIRPWINSITQNQIFNLLRNNYTSKAAPCKICPCNEGSNLCSYTQSKLQDDSCKLYSKWLKSKKASYDINIALPMSAHEREVHDKPDHFLDISALSDKFHIAMKLVLNEKQYAVYDLIYIQNIPEDQISKIMGWKSSEKRSAGYARLNQLKKIFYEKAKEVVKEMDIY